MIAIIATAESRSAHKATHALDDEVVARAIGVRAVLPESGDRRVHEARIHGENVRVVEAVFGESAHLEILDQHIGL